MLTSRLQLPLSDPAVHILQLRGESLVVARVLYHVDNGQQHVVSRLIVWLDGVEESAEDSQCNTSSVVWGGCNRCGKIAADVWEVCVWVLCLLDEVDEMVVGGLQFALGRSIEDAAGGDQLLQHSIAIGLGGSAAVGLTLFGGSGGVGEEGCDVRGDGGALALCAVEVCREFESKLLKVALDERKLRYARHDWRCGLEMGMFR